MEGMEPRINQDHIAGKGEKTLHHYNLVHKLIPMPQAMKLPAVKEADYKECGNLEKILAWNLAKVRKKTEVIEEDKRKGV